MKTKLPTAADVSEFLHLESVKKYNGVYTVRYYFQCVFFPKDSISVIRGRVESNLENGQGNWDWEIISYKTVMKTYPQESYYEFKIVLSEAKDDTEYDARFIPTN